MKFKLNIKIKNWIQRKWDQLTFASTNFFQSQTFITSSFTGAAVAGIFFFIVCFVDGVYLNKPYDILIIIAFLLYFLFLLEFISVKDQSIKNLSKIKVIYPAVLFVVFTSLSWNLVKKIFFFKKYVKSSSKSDLSIE
jgi:hypothetical protein